MSGFPIAERVSADRRPLTDVRLSERLLAAGVERRAFLRFCAGVTATLALPPRFTADIARALGEVVRPALVWLELQDCAGDTESFLRARDPSVAGLILDVLSVDYHETIMVAAGADAEAARDATVAEGGHLVVVEGSVPLGSRGAYCTVGGRSAEQLLTDATRGAAAVINVGTCSAYGGLPAAAPNPTGAVAVQRVVSGVPVLNLPGCPMNVDNLTATVAHYLTFGELPATDQFGRPLFAYGSLIHDTCQRRVHYDARRFVREWGDEGHRKGWCLFRMGCKGPAAFHNCPIVGWNGATSWPVGAGHGCIGCTEPGFWDRMTPFYQRMRRVSGSDQDIAADPAEPGDTGPGEGVRS